MRSTRTKRTVGPLSGSQSARGPEGQKYKEGNNNNEQAMRLYEAGGCAAMKTCNRDKLHHKTERDALDHLAWARKQSHGKGLRDLNVYECSCGGWCVGRAWRGKRERESQSWPEQKTTEPQPKSLTPGQARRKEERERKEAERHQRRAHAFADYRENIAYANQLLDRELALAAATRTKD